MNLTSEKPAIPIIRIKPTKYTKMSRILSQAIITYNNGILHIYCESSSWSFLVAIVDGKYQLNNMRLSEFKPCHVINKTCSTNHLPSAAPASLKGQAQTFIMDSAHTEITNVISERASALHLISRDKFEKVHGISRSPM